jgi:hypothetical protein
MVPIRRHAGDWRAYLAAGAAACLLGGSAQAQQTENHPAKAADVQRQSGADGAKSGNAPAASPSAAQSEQGDTQHASRQGADTAGDKWNLTDTVQAISAFLSAVATTALAFFAALQVAIYRRQTRVMDVTFKATSRAASAASRSARAAEKAIAKSDETLAHSKESAAAALDSSHRMERAYAFISFAGEGGLVLAPPWGFRVIPMISNYGKTPAFVKKISVKGFQHRRPVDGSNCTVGGDIPADYIWTAGQETAMPQFTSYHATHFAWIGMECIYDDIFGESHFSRFLAVVSMEDGGAEFILDEPYWNEWS